MLQDRPLVSVLMTAFNREKYIAEAIESVILSGYENFELIIVDDGSVDKTVEIAKSFSEHDKRIFVYINEKNIGDYPNRNQAASYASGKYLKFLDSDDIIYPHCLGVMVSCIEQYPKAGFALSEVAAVNQPQPVLLEPKDAYYQNFFVSDLFGRAPGSSIINRKAFEKIGGFTGKNQVGDHEFWLMMAREYPLVMMPRDLVWDRVHAEQEQGYDSIIDKSAMHFRVQIEQLGHVECPLSTNERKNALLRLKSQHVKIFLKYLIRKFSLIDAMHYKNSVELLWKDVFCIKYKC